MYYHLIERVDPQQPQAPRKWYPQLKLAGKIGLRRFAEEIVGRSSLTQGDVENCLRNFVDMIPYFLLLGHSISLGDLGTLRLSVHSKGGARTIGEWEVGMIKGVKVIFTPGPLLKSRLKEEVTYELKMDEEKEEARRISRAEAVLRKAAKSGEFLQDQIANLSPEAAQQLLQTLTKQVEAQQKAQAAPADAPDSAATPEATPDTASKTDSKSKK